MKQPSTRRFLTVFISIAAALSLTALSLLAVHFAPRLLSPSDEAPTAATVPSTTAATVPTTAATTRVITPPPSELTATLTAAGLTEAALPADCTQLVTVDSQHGVTIRFYEYADGWKEKDALRCSGFVGMNGVAVDRREGSGTTPVGLFGIGEAFYMHTPPSTALSSFRITEDTYWVDDPASAYYNQRVEGTVSKDWQSAEHMIDYPNNYQYGFVVEYNTACVPDAGSAIFFHVGKNPTAGCIATSEAMVLNYLSVLDAACNPHILIG